MLSTFNADAGGGADSSPPPEKPYAALSEVCSSSSFPPPKGIAGADDDDDDDEEEEGDDGPELGLFLGTTGGRGADVSGRRKGPSAPARILTAEDLAFMGSRASPLSPSSATASSVSSSSSSSPTVGRRSGGAEARRDGGLQRGGGFANPQSQTVVGWPPIRAYRMNSLANHSKDVPYSNVGAAASNKKATSDINMENIEESSCIKTNETKGRIAGNSFLVKVNMDGDPIGRKVDLNAHLSYETLAIALETMFPKLSSSPTSIDGPQFSKLLDGSSVYSLTYEDKDGDWMLVGDVPWGMFLNTVKRLKIMRKNSSIPNGLVSMIL